MLHSTYAIEHMHPGNVPKPEPHFGWVAIVSIYHIWIAWFSQKVTFDIVGVAPLFIKDMCDEILWCIQVPSPWVQESW